tara:strand:- start:2201 stop:3250 length:1050 start_codon:yes stop_codon:yes gene_type:complete
MSTVIVAGGAGYIGAHATKALQNAGFNPVVIDNLIFGHRYLIENVLGVDLVVGQVGDKKLIVSLLSGKHPATIGKKIVGILHFAAYTYVGESVKDPAKYYKNNLADTINMLEAIIQISKQKNIPPIPIVFSSSCATYGIPTEKDIPIKENLSQKPINPYGHTKLMIEQILKDYNYAYNQPVAILRYFNAAGADSNGQLGEDHEPETHLIPLVLKALDSEDGIINVFGNDYSTFDGTCIRDYIHVEDLASAHVLSLKKIIKDKSVSIYNLGNGKGHSIMQVINTAREVTNKDIKIKYLPRREGDPPVLISSTEKAKKELNWVPNFPELETIIKHAWVWYKNNKRRKELGQ